MMHNYNELAQDVVDEINLKDASAVACIADALAVAEQNGMRRAAEIVRAEGRKWPVPANVNMRGGAAAIAKTILADAGISQ